MLYGITDPLGDPDYRERVEDEYEGYEREDHGEDKDADKA